MFADQFQDERTLDGGQNATNTRSGMLAQLSMGEYHGGADFDSLPESSNIDTRSVSDDGTAGISSSPVIENESFAHTATVAYWLPAPLKTKLLHNHDFIPRKEGRWRQRRLEGQFDGRDGSGYVKIHKLNGVVRWHFPLDTVVNVAKVTIESDFPAEFSAELGAKENLERNASKMSADDLRAAKEALQHSEFVSGPVGLKFLTLNDEQCFIVAFKTIEERDMWSYHIRRAICMFEYRTTFEEPSSLRTNEMVHLGRQPNSEAFIESFLKDSGRGEKQINLAIPPCSGVVNVEGRSGELLKWLVIADLSSEENKGMIYLRRQAGNTSKIANKLLSKLPKQLTYNISEPIDLRMSEITITKPWTPWVNIEQRLNQGRRRRLVLYCMTLEIRIKWEEWLVALGATKMPSAEDNVQPGTVELDTGLSNRSFAMGSFRRSSSPNSIPSPNSPSSPLRVKGVDEFSSDGESGPSSRASPTLPGRQESSMRAGGTTAFEKRATIAAGSPTSERSRHHSAERDVIFPPALTILGHDEPCIGSPDTNSGKPPAPPPRVTSFGSPKKRGDSSPVRRQLLPVPIQLQKPTAQLDDRTVTAANAASKKDSMAASPPPTVSRLGTSMLMSSSQLNNKSSEVVGVTEPSAAKSERLPSKHSFDGLPRYQMDTAPPTPLSSSTIEKPGAHPPLLELGAAREHDTSATFGDLVRQDTSFIAESQKFSMGFRSIFAEPPSPNTGDHAAETNQANVSMAQDGSSFTRSHTTSSFAAAAPPTPVQLLPRAATTTTFDTPKPAASTAASTSTVEPSLKRVKTVSLVERMRAKDPQFAAGATQPPLSAVLNAKEQRRDLLGAPSLATSSVGATSAAAAAAASRAGQFFCPLCGMDKVLQARCGQSGRPHVITRANLAAAAGVMTR